MPLVSRIIRLSDQYHRPVEGCQVEHRRQIAEMRPTCLLHGLWPFAKSTHAGHESRKLQFVDDRLRIFRTTSFAAQISREVLTLLDNGVNRFLNAVCMVM